MMGAQPFMPPNQMSFQPGKNVYIIFICLHILKHNYTLLLLLQLLFFVLIVMSTLDLYYSL